MRNPYVASNRTLCQCLRFLRAALRSCDGTRDARTLLSRAIVDCERAIVGNARIIARYHGLDATWMHSEMYAALRRGDLTRVGEPLSRPRRMSAWEVCDA